jgi:hypothetical protein
MGTTRFRRFAAARDVRVATPVAERLVAAAGVAIPAADAPVARQVAVADLALLAALDAQNAPKGSSGERCPSSKLPPEPISWLFRHDLEVPQRLGRAPTPGPLVV